MDFKAVAGTLGAAGAGGAGGYALMSSTVEAAMNTQVDDMRRADETAQRWLADFDAAVPDRSLDTPAEHAALERYLHAHPAPRLVEVVHEDVDAAKVRWDGTWPAKERGLELSLIGAIGGTFTGLAGWFAVGVPKFRIPGALVGAAGLGGAAASVREQMRAEALPGHVSAVDVIHGIK